jgi:hypothetical protein
MLACCHPELATFLVTNSIHFADFYEYLGMEGGEESLRTDQGNSQQIRTSGARRRIGIS